MFKVGDKLSAGNHNVYEVVEVSEPHASNGYINACLKVVCLNYEGMKYYPVPGLYPEELFKLIEAAKPKIRRTMPEWF